MLTAAAISKQVKPRMRKTSLHIVELLIECSHLLILACSISAMMALAA